MLIASFLKYFIKILYLSFNDLTIYFSLSFIVFHILIHLISHLNYFHSLKFMIFSFSSILIRHIAIKYLKNKFYFDFKFIEFVNFLFIILITALISLILNFLVH